jgi:hypothetical protein
MALPLFYVGFLMILVLLWSIPHNDILSFKLNNQSNLRQLILDNSTHQVVRRPKLTDGCSSIYLDLGSNVGIQVRKLFEPEYYPKAQVLPYFDRLFGSVEQRRNTTCAIGFEANPEHADRLRALQECYQAKGWRTWFFVPVAVLNKDNDTIPFYRDNETKRHYWGSSIVADNVQVRDTVNVTTIHLGRFIMEEVVGRLIPDTTAPRSVYAKFDIEGAEYQAIGGLITSGALCHVTEASIEKHQATDPTYTNILSAADFFTQNDAELMGCRTMKINYMDDESYGRENRSCS